MKRRFIIMVAAVVLTISSSYANDNTVKVPESVVAEFRSHFNNAQNEQWEKMDGYYKVTFNDFGKTLYAFYSDDNDFMGLADYITSDKLPFELKSDLKERYSDYWITDLFRYSVVENIGFCITLENADQKIMLKSEGHQKWQLYKTFQK